MLENINQALCRDPEYNPEWWFPESDYKVIRGAARKQMKDPLVLEQMEYAIFALRVCMKCPLMADGSCLEEAMKSPETIDYGIWGGTLASERRAIHRRGNTEVRHEYQSAIRREAKKRGVTQVVIAPRPKERKRNRSEKK